MKLLFLDCETTGLDANIHVPWEVAAVLAEHADDGRLVELARFGGEHPLGGGFVELTERERLAASPIALNVGRFYERYERAIAYTPGEVAAAIDNLCADRPHLVGAVPSFDDRRVGDLMRRCGITPRWHYHLIDVEALVVGYLTAGTPQRRVIGAHGWKSDDLSLALGVDPDGYDRHTAMGDVRWCMAQYAAVFALAQEKAE